MVIRRQCVLDFFEAIVLYIVRFPFADLLSNFARAAAVLYGGQLHVDVLRRAAPAHGAGRGVRQRRVRDALVLCHWLGPAGRLDGRLRLVAQLFRRHYTVSRSRGLQLTV